jgi:mannose-1-phosphate guanylyltransferase
MSADSIVPVILSGGAGTRLWPLSREAAPKPFMPLPDGDTLLGKTLARALSLPGANDIVTITNRDYYFHTKDIYAGLASGQPGSTAFLLEPFGRNTAAAVALAALYTQAHHGDAAVMLVLPADHLIRDHEAFSAAVLCAANRARGGSLVTFGINPTHPETGFGYIECGAAMPDSSGDAPVFRVQRFVEKPPLAQAH